MSLSLSRVIEISAREAKENTSRPVFLDVGSNRGVFATYAARCGFSVYAFEPHPDYIKKLKATFLKSNALRPFTRAGRLHLEPFALSNSVGKVRLHHHAALEGSHSIIDGKVEEDDAFGKRTGLERKSFEISTMKLDSYLQERSKKALAPAIRLIKIDVEGAESMVVEGGMDFIRQYKPDIFTEVRAYSSGVAGHTFREIASLLLPLGYQMYFDKCLGVDLRERPIECEVRLDGGTIHMNCNEFIHADVFFSCRARDKKSLLDSLENSESPS